MMTELSNLAQQWVAFSIVLTVQLLLVLALRKPVRARFGAVACYRLWLLPIAWLPLYFLGPLLLATLATPAPVGGAPGSATPYQQALQQFVEIELLPFNIDIGSTTPAASGDTKIQGWSVLAVLWAAGTVALIFWHTRRWLTFSREVRALGLPLTATEKLYTGTSAHFDTALPVLRLNALNSAAIFGVFKPSLLLPGSFTQHYDEGQRHIILAHEATHLRRGDNGWNLCAMLLIALLWTNPLVYVAWRYFRLDQELSCDALALARCNKEQQKRYARTLLESLRSLSPHALPPHVNQPALSAWDNLGDIKERSLMVHQHMHLAKRPIATAFSLLSLTALGASLTVACADLVSPVAQAADAARPMQAIRVTQEAQRAVQIAQQQLQEVQQGVLAAQQRVWMAQQEVQATQQRAQEVELDVQLAQQRAQEVQQDVQSTRQEVQEVQLDMQEAQQRADDVQQDVLIAQEQAQVARQNVRATQQAIQAMQQTVQTAQQAVEEAQQQIEEARQLPQDPSALIGRTFSEAIAFLNMGMFAEARARLAELDFDLLSPFERSRYEQLQFNLDMVAGNHAGARDHLQAALDSGGLNAEEAAQMSYQLAQLRADEGEYAAGPSTLEAWIAPAAVQPDPVPQARVSPDYPRRALALGLEGWVKVRYTVSETGSVVDAVVVDSKPRRVFDHAAIKAISNWRYDPAMEDAVAVQYAGMETTFRFTLADL